MVATAIEEIIEIEAPVIRTLVDLTIRPGAMCRDYVRGKRRRYANPLRYAIVIAALLVFAIEILDVDLAAPFVDLFQEHGVSPAQTDLSQRLSGVVQQYLNVLVLATLPLIAGLMRLVDRWSGANAAEHLVALLYIYAHLLLAKTLQLLVLPNSMTVTIAMAVLSFAYQFWAFTTFYRRGVWGGVWRTLTMIFVYQSIMLMVGIVGALMLQLGPRIF